jgi:hypothetical protein
MSSPRHVRLRGFSAKLTRGEVPRLAGGSPFSNSKLAVLADTGRVIKTEDGYRLADG